MQGNGGIDSLCKVKGGEIGNDQEQGVEEEGQTEQKYPV